MKILRKNRKKETKYLFTPTNFQHSFGTQFRDRETKMR